MLTGSLDEVLVQVKLTSNTTFDSRLNILLSKLILPVDVENSDGCKPRCVIVDADFYDGLLQNVYDKSDLIVLLVRIRCQPDYKLELIGLNDFFFHDNFYIRL